MGSPRANDHSRYAWGRLYPNKMPVTAVHLMNNDVLPSFEAHGARIATVLSDNGREFCGRPRSPCLRAVPPARGDRAPHHQGPQAAIQRLRRAAAQDPARRALPCHGPQEVHDGIEAMQTDLDAYLVRYNTERPHQGRGMKGRTPVDVFTRCPHKPRTPREKNMKKAA